MHDGGSISVGVEIFWSVIVSVEQLCINIFLPMKKN